MGNLRLDYLDVVRQVEDFHSEKSRIENRLYFIKGELARLYHEKGKLEDRILQSIVEEE